ncbi:MAG TPA: DNA methyltransferase [Alphaproteobacteria bacterium]|nr:DNA methyltransferase [Alphaproteobacteria bacterium]
MKELQVTNIDLDKIKAYPNNPKTHDKKQVTKIVKSIKEFGFVNPVLLDDNLEIIAGHGRVLAAKEVGMQQVPAIILSHLNENQRRAYRIADNKLTELGKWDLELLNIEFTNLSALDLDFDLEITGFETTEIDLIIGGSTVESNPQEDASPVLSESDHVCKRGEIWQLGDHFLICGDSLQEETYRALMGEHRAQMVLTDQPFNISVKTIGSMGKIKHEEFKMASGEMSSEEFINFLTTSMQHMKNYSIDGSLHYLFMDWRNVLEMSTAGKKIYNDFKNICVWNKNSGGMGSLYRSQHELCFVYKNGKAPHTNNVELGANGRYRTNIWNYAGANSFGEGKDNLKLHPTVKPVAMLKDAILDVTKRGDIVLDAFLGSGSTLIACEQTGRVCYGIELEEKYCNVTIKRWQELTGKKAVKIEGGKND